MPHVQVQRARLAACSAVFFAGASSDDGDGALVVGHAGVLGGDVDEG
jgi:hypothetical protein